MGLRRTRLRREAVSGWPDTWRLRVVLLSIGVFAAGLAVAIWLFPKAVGWIPGEAFLLLLFGPVGLVVGLSPAPVVRWTVRHALRIILFLLGAGFAVVGVVFIRSGIHDPQHQWHAFIGAIVILFAGVMLVGSLFASERAVEKMMSWF